MRAAHVSSCAVGFFLLVTTAGNGWAQTTPDDEATIDRVTERIVVRTEAVKADVALAMNQARRDAQTNPGRAEADLKIALTAMRATADIQPDVRAQLTQRLVAAIRHVATHRIAQEERQQETMAAQARRNAQWRSIASQRHDEEKADVLMQRFNQLLDNEQYEDAGEIVAAAAGAIQPNNTAISAAPTVAAARQAHDEATKIARHQNRAVVQSLFASQAAATPMSGASSIEYPATEKWREITLRRKKYSDGQQHTTSVREKRIWKSLDAPTHINFEENALREVTETIGDLHGIDIVLDLHALDELGIDSDSPVSMRLRGVSLRSALRLMLRQIDPSLTFTVADEVLQITTREELEKHLTTRRYTVDSLVLPIHDPSFGGTDGVSANGATQGWGSGRRNQSGNNQNNFQQQNNAPFNFNF